MCIRREQIGKDTSYTHRVNLYSSFVVLILVRLVMTSNILRIRMWCKPKRFPINSHRYEDVFYLLRFFLSKKDEPTLNPLHQSKLLNSIGSATLGIKDILCGVCKEQSVLVAPEVRQNKEKLTNPLVLWYPPLSEFASKFP